MKLVVCSLVLLAALSAQLVHACSCARFDAKYWLDNSRDVIEISVERVSSELTFIPASSDFYKRVDYRLLRSFKNDFHASEPLLVQTGSSAGCGTALEEGKKYLAVVDHKRPSIIDLCSHAPSSEALTRQLVEELKKKK